ncbi:MAG: DNA cytosine methyltransferase, partial [Rhizobiaceae bacterium]
MEFKLGEFFCGPGGIALGAIKCGVVVSPEGETFSVRPDWATDYDLDTCETFSRNIHKKELTQDSNVIHEDIRKINIQQLQKCDGFAFGFPCNDFSVV